MTLKLGPNTGLLSYGEPGEAHYNELVRQWRWIDFFANPNVTSITLSTPPGQPEDGAAFIVGKAATGAWAGREKQIARYTKDLLTPVWEFLPAKEGSALIFCLADRQRYQFISGEWTVFSGGGGAGGGSATGDLIIAASDMDTDLTAGTMKAYAPIPRPGAIVGVKANLRKGSEGSQVRVMVYRNTVPILSTPITIEPGMISSVQSLAPAVISNGLVTADDQMSIGIIDPGLRAKGLVVTLLFNPVLDPTVEGDQVAWGKLFGAIEEQTDLMEEFAKYFTREDATTLKSRVTDIEAKVGKYVTTIGDGAAASFLVNHNLNTFDVHVTVYRSATPKDTAIVDVHRITKDQIEISGFDIAPSQDQWTVVVSK